MSAFDGLLLFELDNGGDADTIAQLLKQGANPNQRYDDGCTALYVAVEFGYSKIVELLVEFGADVNAKKLDSGETPLLFAIELGHLNIVQFLLSHGADANEPNSMGDPPIYFAAFSNHHAIAISQALISAGANVNALNSKHQSALHAASQNGNVDIVRLLINAGADVNYTLFDGAYLYTPLSRAINQVFGDRKDLVAEHLAIIEILLENGAMLNTDNCDLFTAHRASRRAEQARKTGNKSLAMKLDSIAALKQEIEVLTCNEDGTFRSERSDYLLSKYSRG
jgi:ankyrin repeat protein